uniref:Uncharacterized protein n=1 Tax=Moniliophthora roreri TaxID=221103 RepID=A0A0W0GC10_MONRR
MSYDCLHGGVGLFQHLYDEIKPRVEKLSNKASSTIDSQIAEIPQWQGLTHFSSATSIAFTDGSKYEDLAKQIGFCLLNVLLKEADNNGWILLCCSTIEWGRAAALQLSQLIQEYESQVQRQNEEDPKLWNFLKAHTYQHAFDDIVKKGVTHNYNTKINEQMHGLIKDAYHLQINFKNFAPQILQVEHCSYVATLIQHHINEQDAYLIQQAATQRGDNLIEHNFDTASAESVVICVPGKKLSFKDLEAAYCNNSAFSGFHTKFQNFLGTFF